MSGLLNIKRYTWSFEIDFKELGTKEGLVGKRLISRIDTLKKVFNDYDIKTNIIVLVVTEATEPNCQRLGISE